MHRNMGNFDLFQIIYLRTRPEVAYERILSRQRAEENKMPFKYIKGLSYFMFYDKMLFSIGSQRLELENHKLE